VSSNKYKLYVVIYKNYQWKRKVAILIPTQGRNVSSLPRSFGLQAKGYRLCWYQKLKRY